MGLRLRCAVRSYTTPHIQKVHSHSVLLTKVAIGGKELKTKVVARLTEKVEHSTRPLVGKAGSGDPSVASRKKLRYYH